MLPGDSDEKVPGIVPKGLDRHATEAIMSQVNWLLMLLPLLIWFVVNASFK
jgi:hypothetical protein